MKPVSFCLALFLGLGLMYGCGSAGEKATEEQKEETAEAPKEVMVPEPAAEYALNDLLKAVSELPGDRDGWNGKWITVKAVISKYGVTTTTTEDRPSPYYSFTSVVDPQLMFKAKVSDRKEVNPGDSLLHIDLSKEFTEANADWDWKPGDTVRVKVMLGNQYPAKLTLTEGELVK